MKKDKLSTWQVAILLFFPIFSLFQGFGTYSIINMVGINSYLSILLAYFIGFIILRIFFIIFNFNPNMNIFEKNKYLFGKIVGNFINYIIIFLIFFMGIFLLCDVSLFISKYYFDGNSIFLFMIVMGFIIILFVRNGIVTIARVSVIFFFLVIILSLIGVIGLIPHIDINNLLPFIDNGFNSIFMGGIYFSFITILPIYLLLMIKKDNIKPIKDFNRRIILLYSISFGLIFLIHIFNIMVLGRYLSSLYQYPSYISLEKVSFFQFIDRIEKVISLRWIFISVISISLIINSIHEYKINSLYILLLMIVISYIISFNIYLYRFMYYIFPICSIILLFIYLIIGITIIKRKN